MSYIVTWDINVKKMKNAISTYREVLKAICMWEDNYCGFNNIEERIEEELEWYKDRYSEDDKEFIHFLEGNLYDADMAKEMLAEVSAKFPDMKFFIDGAGEENGDMWKAYAYRGKVEILYAKIVFPTLEDKELEWED